MVKHDQETFKTLEIRSVSSYIYNPPLSLHSVLKAFLNWFLDAIAAENLSLVMYNILK